MSPQLRLICAQGRHHAYVFTGTQGVSALATDPKGAPGTPVAPCKKKRSFTSLQTDGTRTHTHPHARANARAHAHAHRHTRTRTHAHAHTHTRTHPHTHTPTRPHTHTPTHPHAHPHAHKHARVRYMHTIERCMMHRSKMFQRYGRKGPAKGFWVGRRPTKSKPISHINLTCFDPLVKVKTVPMSLRFQNISTHTLGWRLSWSSPRR